MTKNAATLGSISTLCKNSRVKDSERNQTQVNSSRPVSMKAEKFSILPWPYW